MDATEYMQQNKIAIMHELKTWPEYFQAILEGRKKFEVRYDDRAFRVGDVLRLKEFLPETKQYTGRKQDVKVTYMLDDENEFGKSALQLNIVVMSIELLDEFPF